MIKELNDEVYKIMCDWWNSYEFPRIPRKSLPDTTYIVYKDNIPVIAGSLYLLRSGNLAWVSWVISNPEVRGTVREEGFADLINIIENVAKANGVDLLFTVALRNKTKFLKKYTNNGFTVQTEDVVQLTKVLGGT